MIKWPRQSIPEFSGVDIVLTLLLSTFSVVTHLWMIQNPDCVVFDEVHFGNFTNWYTLSRYFFDIHPPLGKLVMFGVANFSEYYGDINFEARYGKQHVTPDFVILRLTPAIFSSFCAPLIYLAMRFSGFSHSAASLSGFCLACDTSMLTEGRFTLSDGMLHFFVCLYIAVFAYFCGTDHDFASLGALVRVGGVLGCACACKNTAWGLMVYTGFVQIVMLLQRHASLSFEFFDELMFRGFTLLGMVIIVHLVSFGIHLTILPFEGPGNGYLPEMMQRQLLDSSLMETQLWGRRVTWPSLYFRIVALVVSMHFGNMAITSFHPYMSRPINWPLLTGNFVAFWFSNGLEVDCIGNAFVYYFAFFSILAVLLGFKREKWEIAVRFAVGWAVSYFPFYLIPRSMYLYHYLIPLMFGCMCTGASIDLWLRPFWRGVAVVLIGTVVLFGFYLWSPLSYGTPHLNEKFIIWNSAWRYGDKYHQELAKRQK